MSEIKLILVLVEKGINLCYDRGKWGSWAETKTRNEWFERVFALFSLLPTVSTVAPRLEHQQGLWQLLLTSFAS